MRVILTIVLLGGLFSCKNVHQNAPLEITDTTFYKSNKIHTILKSYIGDSIVYQYDYYENGVLKAKGSRKKGKMDGLSYEYDSTAKLNASIRWLNGKQFGNSIWYYNNGVIEQYECYDFNSHCRFKETFDNKGRLVSRSGELVPQLLFISDSLYVNEGFEFYVCTADPPQSKKVFHMIQYDSNYKLLEIREVFPKDNIITLSKKYSIAGKYRQYIIGESFDTENKLIQSDTLKTNFTVIDRIRLL